MSSSTTTSDAANAGGRAARRVASNNAPRHYRTQEVVSALGVTRRQLQYWAKTGLVIPSAQTEGGHHRYNFTDLVAVKAAKRLIDAGVSVQRIRSCVEALGERLPEIGRPLSELVIVATGDVLLVIGKDSVFEVLSGQEWVFEVAQFQRELDEWEAQNGTNPASPVRRARPVRRQKEQQRTAS